ncbi:hypothetical protein [Bacillus gaemokensis]|uniref:Uncharacterized protein n=1 Tax=Bacillus gaemokensis TaxID=574375 RepID=A0A073KNL9_9BACI|nr:hypothetical protein [Bacillus gaemokensis]KEK23938.1 hypothetical protein BAGA_05835 [Bacillus gaemokensis]KYG38060.1 hypothetical protein AZF08_20080 [Bacillus gaemokensis]
MVVDIKPSLLVIQPFDATKGASIYYTYTGSKQSLKNQLVVTDTKTNEIVYSFEYSSYEKVHHVPPNILLNGKSYKAKIRAISSDGDQSPYSNEVQFKTFSNPVLDIDNIDGQGYVYNSDVTFIAIYSQSEGESVKTYRFSLFDENEDLIENYPIRVPSAPNSLTEVVRGLEKGKGYFIECSIETVNGVVWTHRERFIPLYIVPSVNGVINTRNDSDEGVVKVTANLKQLLGTQVTSGARTEKSEGQIKEDYKYEGDEWVIVPKGKPVIFKGLGMNRASDFVMKVWCKKIPNGTKFLDLSPVDNTGIAIEFWKYSNKVIAVKKYGRVVSRHCSNVVTIPYDSPFMLYAKAIEHRIDLSIKIL